MCADRATNENGTAARAQTRRNTSPARPGAWRTPPCGKLTCRRVDSITPITNENQYGENDHGMAGSCITARIVASH